MKTVYFVLIFLFSILSQTFNAQNDTFLLRIKKLPHDSDRIIAISDKTAKMNIGDSERVDAYHKLGSDLAQKINHNLLYFKVNLRHASTLRKRRNFESAHVLTKNLLRRAYKTNCEPCLASCYLDFSNLMASQDNYRRALFYADSALIFFQKSKNESGIWKGYYTKARFYNRLFKQDSALINLSSALKNAIERRDTSNIGDCYVLMTAIYIDDQQFQKTLSSAKEALKYFANSKNFYTLGILYGNIAIAYQGMRVADSLIYYAKLSVSTCIEAGDFQGESFSWNALGAGYVMKKEFALAEEAFFKSLTMALSSQNPRDICTANLNLGNMYLKQKKYDKAEECLKQALKLSKESGTINVEQDTYILLSELYKNIGDYKKAYEYSQVLKSLSDSIYSEEHTRTIAEFDVKYNNHLLQYEKEKTENEKLVLQNENLKAKQNQNILFTVGSILIIAMLFTFYIYNQRAKRREEKKHINTMLLSEEKERTRIARELHDGLGQLLSTARINAASLEGSIHEEDSIFLTNTLSLLDLSVKEVRAVSHNLMPQLLADKGLLEALTELIRKINDSRTLDIEFTHIGFNQSLNKNVEIAVYRVVQEVLNNIIRHSAASKVTVRLQNNQSNLNIFITDNGKGLDVNSIEKSEGLGWKNIFTRLSLINGKIGIDSIKGKGTKINIDVAI